VRAAVGHFCEQIVKTLREPWVQRTKEENVARALEVQLRKMREDTAALIKKKIEDMDRDRQKGGWSEDLFPFTSRMWEILLLDQAQQEIMNLIVEVDNQQAELAKQRDKVYRKILEPGKKQEYERLKSRSDELEPRRERLTEELDFYKSERDRVQAC
jgi:hypothetical protein